MATETGAEEVRLVWVDSVKGEGSPGSTGAGLPEDRDRLALASLGFRATAWVIDLLVVLLLASIAPVVGLPFVYGLIFFFIAYHTTLVWLTETTVGKALF